MDGGRRAELFGETAPSQMCKIGLIFPGIHKQEEKCVFYLNIEQFKQLSLRSWTYSLDEKMTFCWKRLFSDLSWVSLGTSVYFYYLPEVESGLDFYIFKQKTGRRKDRGIIWKEKGLGIWEFFLHRKKSQYLYLCVSTEMSYKNQKTQWLFCQAKCQEQVCYVTF